MAARGDALERERRWALPAALASLAAVACVVGAIVVAAQVGGGDGDSELLRNVDAHSSAQLISSILQAIGVCLLAIPLLFLFRAAEARSDAVRGQLVGVVVAGPIFLAVSAILIGTSTISAANDFVTNEVPGLLDKGVALDSERADDVANDSIGDAPLRALAAGFGLGGQLGFVVGMFYTAMQAMRVGLLTRFWGSLGMALGAVSFLFFQFALLWFIYLGLLIAGWVPGGRPPAWAEGRAIPWPTPGEQAASRIEETDQPSADESDGDPSAEGPDERVEGDRPAEGGALRKRKRRD
jgi:hypothetical protein